MDLLASPEWIVDTVEPRTLLKAARGVPDWSDEVRQNIDHALCHWTRNAIARAEDVEGLLDLQSVVGWFADLLPRHADEEGGRSMELRWKAYFDLLEAHRIALAARDPQKVRARKHVDRILDYLKRGEVEQKQLRAALGLSESRLAQLLSVMEFHGLAVREKRGRVNFVRSADSVSGARQTQTNSSDAAATRDHVLERFAAHLKKAA